MKKILGFKIPTWEGWKKAKTPEPEASFTKPMFNFGPSVTTFAFNIYNGEKSIDGIGPPIEFSIDGITLRTRGWEAYLTNESVQTIINKSVIWVIGCGLKLQAEPMLAVLKSEGIDLEKEFAQELSDLIEARFSLYKEQKWATYNKEKNISQLESVTYRNAKVGGDILCVIHFDGEFPKIRLFDGAHVKSPQGGDDWNPRLLENGNRIINGVEMNDNGEHVAYHIQNADLTWKRIEAWSSSTGLRLAYLVGGIEFRLDYARCMPAISGILEVLATMERYKQATLETAEETAKMSYQIKYGPTSTGENPLAKSLAAARDAGGNKGAIPVDSQLKQMRDTFAVSTNKTVVQNVTDSEIAPIEKSSGELYFKDFFSMFFDIVCGTLNIPPNVAMSKYDSNFSAARAAIKDWEHTLMVERYNFANSFLQPIYEFFLFVEASKSKINMPGYLDAFKNNNRMVIASYNKARWIGDNVPHIDPLKEVTAIRDMLGDTGASLPLIDHEGAVERLGGGNAKSIMQQYSQELADSKAKGIKPEVPPLTGGAKPEGDPPAKN